MNILTFDIEEWFHILDHDNISKEHHWDDFEYRLEKNLDRILDLLIAREQKATFFVLGWVARKFPELVKKISLSGFEIGSHSDLHQLVYNQDRNSFREDLKKSIDSIESIIGKKVISYRAPGFSLKPNCEWAFEELVSEGIEIDCSIFPERRAHGGFEKFGNAKPTIVNFNGIKIKEFPINLYYFFGKSIIFSGGGYFRLIPYAFIKHMCKSSDYIMTYFHPRDFDPLQPMINDLSLFRKFKSYYGLRSSFDKLNRILNDFQFIDLETANKEIEWKLVSEKKLNNSLN